MNNADETAAPSVPDFVKWLETEHPRLFLYYLTVLGLEQHLGRYVDESPIRGLDPVTLDIRRLIAQRYPQLGTRGAFHFQLALQAHFYETGAIQEHLEYTPPG